MARIVKGTVKDTNGVPVPNLRVRAWDEDSPSDDDLMGSAVTDSNGQYAINYRGGDWDLALPGTTTWRPDIYVTVEVQNNSGGYTRVARSRTYQDHKLKNDLTVDFAVAPASATEKKVIAFDPRKHGFHFVNSFVVKPSLLGVSLGSWHMGFCGGMSAGALKHYKKNSQAPVTTTVPVQGDALFDELLDRQKRSLSANTLAKIIQWQVSPDEPHTFTPHSLSYRTKQEWPNLYDRIKKDEPTGIVLIRVEGPTADPSQNHQVLAFGYEWNPTTKDLTLHVYDPNRPDQTIYLTMALSGSKLRARDSSGARLRGFFVNPRVDSAAT